VQKSAGKGKKQTEEQRLRAVALARYEEDRACQKERTAREKRLRGEFVAAMPITDHSSDIPMPHQTGGAVMGTRGKSPLMHAHETAAVASLVTASPSHVAAAAVEAAAQKTDSEGDEDEEEGATEEDQDEEADDMRGMLGSHTVAGLRQRQRFPGQGNRLGRDGE
jgi:hypothetical protein